MNDLEIVLEEYSNSLKLYIPEMVKQHALRYETANKDRPMTDALIRSKGEYKISDSAYLYAKSIAVKQNIRDLYTRDTASFPNVAAAIKIIDLEFQKEFSYEGLSPNFYKEAHRKVENQ